MFIWKALPRVDRIGKAQFGDELARVTAEGAGTTS
jgi:hypothetical protein